MPKEWVSGCTTYNHTSLHRCVYLLNLFICLQAVAGAAHNISVISIVEARVIALLQGGLPIGMTFMTHKLHLRASCLYQIIILT